MRYSQRQGNARPGTVEIGAVCFEMKYLKVLINNVAPNIRLNPLFFPLAYRKYQHGYKMTWVQKHF